jgi:hypothetical protein
MSKARKMDFAEFLGAEIAKLVPDDVGDAVAETVATVLAGIGAGVIALTSGQFQKHMVERAASDLLANRDLADADRRDIADDLSMFQEAMDDIVKSGTTCDKKSVIIAISKAFIIGLQSPQSDEIAAAIRAATERSIRQRDGKKGVDAKKKEAEETWHPHAEALAKACPRPKSKADIVRYIRGNWKLAKSLLLTDRTLERFVTMLVDKGEIHLPT